MLGAIAQHYADAAPTTYDGVVLSDSPLAYWRMGDTSGTTLTDSSGNSRSSTLTGVYSLNQTGLIAGSSDPSVWFNGGQASCASAAWMDVTSAITFECWVKFTTLSGVTGIVSRWQNSGSATVGLLWLNGSGRLSFDLVVGGSQRHAEGAVASLNTRYHMVGTYDGTAVRLYIDGSQVASVSATGNITTGTSSIDLANFASGAVSGMRAYLDEVAIYGTALSSTRVAAHYAAG